MNDANFSSAIRLVEQQRCAAMLAHDLTALDELLDPDLQFHHATGQTDAKPGYLAKVAAGRIRYVAIRWMDDRVTSLGADAAMLTGRMVTDVVVDGIDKRLDNRVIAVWRRPEGGWQMVGFQSTPLAA
jgi:hypothetical protein